MLIKTLPVGHLETNCYIVTDEKTLKCAVIDPGADANTILDYIEENKLTPEKIFLTHGHFDHHMALDKVHVETGATVWINKKDVVFEVERNMHQLFDPGYLNYYNDGDILEVGGLVFHVMETPGHSWGSVTLRCEDALFTGDVLFKDSCGRTDLGGDMRILLESLKRISALEGDFEVYPGHAEQTTLNRERAHNYYVKYANSEMEP